MNSCITGVGLVTSLGADPATVFAELCSGTSGVKPLQAFDTSRFTTRVGYEIADRHAVGTDEPLRCTRWLCEAINQAVRGAGLDVNGGGRIRVIAGTGLRELRSLELWHADGMAFQMQQLHFGEAVRDCLSADVPVLTISNACAATNFALGIADDVLSLGEADAVIVAGCDSITESMFGLLDRVNPRSPESLQPFEQERKGVIMGEGAAAVVLEPPQKAASRGVAPTAVVRGVGMSCDGEHETAPSQAGIVESIHDAHRRAGVLPEEVDLVLVHGTGTQLNDKIEALALGEVFTDCSRKPPITGIKSMTGHTAGASGLVGVVTAIQIMVNGLIPPTVGLVTPIPESSPFAIVGPQAQAADVRIAQVNAFGFGGVNAVAILEKVSS